MMSRICSGSRIVVSLFIVGVTAGCITGPSDETVIASLDTPVRFSGYATSNLGADDDAATAARPFYVLSWNPSTGKREALGASALPSSDPVEHGNYDWHELEFGERVIPAWAWTSEPTRWHAQLGIADSGRLFPERELLAFTGEELGCYFLAIGDGGDKLVSGINCGGDFTVDLYVNK